MGFVEVVVPPFPGVAEVVECCFRLGAGSLEESGKVLDVAGKGAEELSVKFGGGDFAKMSDVPRLKGSTRLDKASPIRATEP